MRIRPLTGEVLVSMLPDDTKSGGIFLPEQKEEKKPARKGIVHEIGPWPKTKTGMGVLPEFGKGATVLFSEYCGNKLTWYSHGDLRLVKTTDILAVLT